MAKKKKTKRVKPKLSKKVVPTKPKADAGGNDVTKKTDIELARLLQAQFTEILGHKAEIERCQRNIFSINNEMDKRDKDKKGK
jgi:hypothetical protein